MALKSSSKKMHRENKLIAAERTGLVRVGQVPDLRQGRIWQSGLDKHVLCRHGADSAGARIVGRVVDFRVRSMLVFWHEIGELRGGD